MCIGCLIITWLLAILMGYNAGEAAGLLAGALQRNYRKCRQVGISMVSLSLEGATKLGEEVSEQYAVSPARLYEMCIRDRLWPVLGKTYLNRYLSNLHLM